MPHGIRHIFYFLRVVLSLRGVDTVLALDTFSVGLPATAAALLFRKKIIIRAGGDFLWESYVERTKEKVLLSNFYTTKRPYSFKETFIFHATKWLLENCSMVVCSTAWQRDIFVRAYNIEKEKTRIVENYYPEKKESTDPAQKNFLWAGRRIHLKNIETLERVATQVRKKNASLEIEISEIVSREALLKKIHTCYAVILPSLSEVSPNFILEAIMFGKPFIVTRDCGLHDKLQDIGVFIEPLDEQDIAQKILFLADEENYRAYREKIASFSFTHSYKDIARECIEIFETL